MVELKAFFWTNVIKPNIPDDKRNWTSRYSKLQFSYDIIFRLVILSEMKPHKIRETVSETVMEFGFYHSWFNLTQNPLLRQDPASLRPPAAVLSDADACLPHSFADSSSTQLNQLHQTLSGRLGVLRYKHGWLVLEQVLLVLPSRKVPLETTDLGQKLIVKHCTEPMTIN